MFAFWVAQSVIWCHYNGIDGIILNKTLYDVIQCKHWQSQSETDRNDTESVWMLR